eukprot:scaffold5852_cov68-Skeletonema_dohrnii-CCMP3373.AAC.2
MLADTWKKIASSVSWYMEMVCQIRGVLIRKLSSLPADSSAGGNAAANDITLMKNWQTTRYIMVEEANEQRRG